MRSDRQRGFWLQPLAFAVMVVLGLTGLKFIHGELPQFAWIVGSGVVGGLVALAVGKIVRRLTVARPEQDVEGRQED